MNQDSSEPWVFASYLTEKFPFVTLVGTLEKVFDFWNEVCRKTVFKRKVVSR